MQKQIGESDGVRNGEKSSKTPFIEKKAFLFRRMCYTIIYLK